MKWQKRPEWLRAKGLSPKHVQSAARLRHQRSRKTRVEPAPSGTSPNADAYDNSSTKSATEIGTEISPPTTSVETSKRTCFESRKAYRKSWMKNLLRFFREG